MQTTEQKLQMLQNLRTAGKTDEAFRSAVGDLLFSLKDAALSPAPPSKETLHTEAVCLRLLRENDNQRYAALRQCEFFGCDLCALLEHASLCADVLLSAVGCNLFFDGETLLCGVAPTLLLSAFLNLVANAVRFGGERDIFVTLKQTAAAAVLQVKTNRSAALPAKYKDGLRCVENICHLHKGRLLLAADAMRFCAVMELQTTLPWTRLGAAPMFSQYLSERVSPVRIALSQVLP